jgi:hypothetical protein
MVAGPKPKRRWTGVDTSTGRQFLIVEPNFKRKERTHFALDAAAAAIRVKELQNGSGGGRDDTDHQEDIGAAADPSGD